MNNKGFSLLEVLIGLLILSIGVLAISGMQVFAIKSNFFSESLTQAVNLAQSKMEDLKKETYANLKNEMDVKIISGISYERHVLVEENAGNNIKIVTVTVNWVDHTNHSISLSTIRSK